MWNNPNLFPELRVGSNDPAEAWRPREASQGMKENTITDSNSSFARATSNQDGSFTADQSSKVLRTSSGSAVADQNAAAGVPYDYALDPKTRCQIAPGDLKEDSILFFHGKGEVTLASARALGWYSPATSAQPQPANGARNEPFNEGQEQSKEATDPALQFDLLADEAVDREYSALVDTTYGMEQTQAIAQIVENGEMDQRTLGNLASQLRCEPDQLAARVAPIMSAFKEQALAVMSEGGLDGNAVVAWAQQNKPEALKQAMNRQATMRQAGGYADLRREYVETLAEHSPQLALSANLGPGITSRLDPKHGVLVNIPGIGEMKWASAIRAFGPK